MSDIWDLTPEEALAEELVDEALSEMDIPKSLLPAIRVTLLGELLTTPEGHAKLRRLMADPKVARSGEVLKRGAAGTESPAEVRKIGDKRGKSS